MLRAAASVLKPGGSLAFFAIAPPAGQSATDRERVRNEGIGPGFHLTDAGYDALMATAGFVEVTVEDLTAKYHETLAAWIRERHTHREQLVALLGREAVDDRRASDLKNLQAIEDGLITRVLISGIRP